MNDYDNRYLHFDIETLMSDYDYVVKESHMDALKVVREFMSECEKNTMEDWFEDKTIVDKSIPEFNFV